MTPSARCSVGLFSRRCLPPPFPPPPSSNYQLYCGGHTRGRRHAPNRQHNQRQPGMWAGQSGACGCLALARPARSLVLTPRTQFGAGCACPLCAPGVAHPALSPPCPGPWTAEAGVVGRLPPGQDLHLHRVCMECGGPVDCQHGRLLHHPRSGAHRTGATHHHWRGPGRHQRAEHPDRSASQQRRLRWVAVRQARAGGVVGWGDRGRSADERA